ncbi:MAG: hypothetical protein WBM00_04200, partial [Solirubrobacterales bacterium]
MTHVPVAFAAWPLAASMAAVMTVYGLRAGRRRNALNQALHEVRRPLQALALAAGRDPAAIDSVEGSLRLAASALEQLDREINGGAPPSAPEAIPMLSLVDSSVRRWRTRTTLSGGSIALDWNAGGAVVDGDSFELARAVDNLIVNAIEHGGPAIAVEAHRHGHRLRLTVADSGRAARRRSRRGTAAQALAHLSGRRRHGHG